jgi:hypothetical protein
MEERFVGKPGEVWWRERLLLVRVGRGEKQASFGTASEAG